MTVAKGLEAVGSYDGRAIAFVSEGEKEPPAIWETTGRAEWTRTGALTGRRLDRPRRRWRPGLGRARRQQGVDLGRRHDVEQGRARAGRRRGRGRRRRRVRRRRVRRVTPGRDVRRPATVRRSHVDVVGRQDLGADAGDRRVQGGDGDQAAGRRPDARRLRPARSRATRATACPSRSGRTPSPTSRSPATPPTRRACRRPAAGEVDVQATCAARPVRRARARGGVRLLRRVDHRDRHVHRRAEVLLGTS